MKEYNTITYDILESHKGEYIQLGGRGILNGLKFSPSKFEVWKICDLSIENKNTENAFSTGVYLRKYRCRKSMLLPSYHFDQQCRVYTSKEYGEMPVYS